MKGTPEQLQLDLTLPTARHCLQCGSVLDGPNPRQTYCCNQCQQRYYRATNRAKRAAYNDAYRASHREELNAYQVKYEALHKQEHLERLKAWRAAHPGAHSAQERVATAFPDKKPCVICGHPKTERHHPDYNKPMEIIWLCHSCHKLTHTGRIKIELEAE